MRYLNKEASTFKDKYENVLKDIRKTPFHGRNETRKLQKPYEGHKQSVLN